VIFTFCYLSLQSERQYNLAAFDVVEVDEVVEVDVEDAEDEVVVVDEVVEEGYARLNFERDNAPHLSAQHLYLSRLPHLFEGLQRKLALPPDLVATHLCDCRQVNEIARGCILPEVT
jgi:hypothetical protein